MNILFVHCKYGLFEIDSGAANRSTMFVKALSQLGHVDIISFSESTVKSTIPNCDLVWNNSVPYKVGILGKLLRCVRLFLTPWHPGGYYFVVKRRKAIVMQQYHTKHYDFVAIRYIGDAFSAGLTELADNLVVDVDDNLVSSEKWIFATKSFKYPWSKSLSIRRMKNIGLMQNTFLRTVKCSFFSNILEPPCDKSVYLHNVTAVIDKLQDITNNTVKRILIVGYLDYLPNKNGTLHFVNHIYPIIRKKVNDVELHIVGKSSDMDFMKYLNSMEGVSALGYVEDIQSEYRDCRVIVVPIYHGAGTCVKFIEGLMMNRPMVSTPVGARGFDGICFPNEHYMLAENDIQFAEKTCELLNSVELANKIAQKAFNVGTENFSQKRFCEIVKEEIMQKFNS